MLEFMKENWTSILAVLILVGWTIYLVITRKWDYLRAKAYEIILYAENYITGTKRGKERFELVIRTLYSLIPGWLRFIITEQTLREKLQEWFDILKDAMDNGKIDNSTGTNETNTTSLL